VPKCFILVNVFVNCVLILVHEMTWIKISKSTCWSSFDYFNSKNGKSVRVFQSLEHSNS
jgi:hypothetical protein